MAAVSLIAVLAGATGLAAQEPAGAGPTEPTSNEPSILPTGDDEAPPGPRLWSLEANLGGIYDSNFQRDEDELNREGVVAGLVGRYQNRERRPSFRLEYGAAIRSVSTTGRGSKERLTQRLRSSYIWRFADRWNLETIGQLSSKITTTEVPLADEALALARLGFQVDRTHRVRFYGGYWVRRYDDATESRGESPVLGIDYRNRVGVGEYWELRAQYEDNDADRADVRFRRWLYTARYTLPFGAADRVRFGLDYRSERYGDRPIASGTALDDDKWVVSALWTHEFDSRFRLQGGYNFRIRDSNDESRDFESHRATANLRYRW